MKKSAALAAMLCLIGALAFSEAQNTSTAPHADRGDLIANAGALFGYYGFGVGGGVEYIFGRWDIAKSAPLTFGGAARGNRNIVLYQSPTRDPRRHLYSLFYRSRRRIFRYAGY